MDPTAKKMLVKQVRTLVTDTIRKASARDKQKLLGPSDLGDPCDKCLAQKFEDSMSEAPFKRDNERDFSLKAWTGTAVHEKLERDFVLGPDEVRLEKSFPIWELEGYGVIKGHVDGYWERIATLWDHKTVDMVKLKRIKATGRVPMGHVNQQMLYCLGIKRAGLPIKLSTIVYIPRDNNDVRNVHVMGAEFDEDYALTVVARAERIYQQVCSAGAVGFESDDDCFPCHRY
jgi:hypothetical protein